MFVHQQHLRHLLRPDHYISEDQHRAEIRHVFQPSWHPIATASELARPGQFLTFNLMGTPLLLRNMDGEIVAFLNVCPHRHSLLSDLAKGCSPKLKCQYHGWEFDQSGRTGKIPDARAFRPWDRENSCLRKYRVEKCGEVIFVCLEDSTPTLREWLGPLWEKWSSAYGGDYSHAGTWEKEFHCNWKVVLENSLESYHIPQVHPSTFKEFPEEANAWHELDSKYSSFRTMTPNDFANRAQDWMVRRLGGLVTNEYWHRVRHPHITGGSLDSCQMIQCVWPTSPTTCRYRSLFFTLRGQRNNPFSLGVYWFLRSIATMVSKKVFAEDGAIYAGVQQGMAASPHPGVIGTREERIYHFQQFVLEECRGARELSMAPEMSQAG